MHAAREPPFCGSICGARLKETRTYRFDVWRVALSSVRHYTRVHPTGHIVSPDSPARITHEVALALDVALFSEVWA